MSAGKLNLMILQGKLNLRIKHRVLLTATVLLSGLNGVVLPLVMSQGRGTAPRSCMARAAHCAASWSVTDTSDCCCCSCCRWCFRAPSTLLNARILVSSHIHRNALRWIGLWMEQTLLSFSFIQEDYMQKEGHCRSAVFQRFCFFVCVTLFGMLKWMILLIALFLFLVSEFMFPLLSVKSHFQVM